MKKACVLVAESNGDWARTSVVYRNEGGEVAVAGKELLVFAYMAKERSYPDTDVDADGNNVQRENFKRIRNYLLGYIGDSNDYGATEDFQTVNAIEKDSEVIYLVSIKRGEDDTVKIAVKYLEIADDGVDFEDKVQNLIDGNVGTEIVLAVK